MNRHAFQKLERDYTEAMQVIDEARQERRAIQLQKMLDDSILDAYEQIEQTTCCDIGELK